MVAIPGQVFIGCVSLAIVPTPLAGLLRIVVSRRLPPRRTGSLPLNDDRRVALPGTAGLATPQPKRIKYR